MTSKTTDRKARNEAPQVQKIRRPVLRAPRPVWEPEPLHAPVPDRPHRESNRVEQDISSPRGVVVINYGDEE